MQPVEVLPKVLLLLVFSFPPMLFVSSFTRHGCIPHLFLSLRVQGKLLGNMECVLLRCVAADTLLPLLSSVLLSL